MSATQIEIIARDGDRELFRRTLAPGEYVIGREPGCAIELTLDGVSRRHAKLFVSDVAVFIEDLDSINGTRLDGHRIRERTRIAAGMPFQTGGAKFEWQPVKSPVKKIKPPIVSSDRKSPNAPGPVPVIVPHGPRRRPPVARAPGSRSPNPAVERPSPVAKILAALAIVGVLAFFLNQSARQPAGNEAGSHTSGTDTTQPTSIGFEKKPSSPAPDATAKLDEPQPAPQPVPAPAPATMAERVKPEQPPTKPEEAYPGVPTPTYSVSSPAGDPDSKKLLAAVKWASANTGWARLHADLKSALVALGGSGSTIGRGDRLERMLDLKTPSLMLAQERFIRAIGEDVLNPFTADRDRALFLEWLFARPAILTAFADTIRTQDNRSGALETWWQIWLGDTAGREEFANLAIACALVFDNPVAINPAVFGATSESGSTAYQHEVNALQRYRFYRDSSKRGSLRAPLHEMTPRDLVWVIDAPVPESELVWAQKHMTLARAGWSHAYGMIRYRMDRATQGVNPYKEYTLAEILKEGGICGDQAYFAAMTAKANGIPAMVIGGVGDRGGHAWFGYKVSRNTWSLTTGRYADNYAAGSTADPQTHETLKEHELRMFADPARRTDGWMKSDHLIALAKLFFSADRDDLAAVAIDDALRTAPKHPDAWFEKLDSIRAAGVGVDEWKHEVARMRTAFHGYSDVVQRIDRMEADYIAQQGDYDAARKLVRRDAQRMSRKDGERTDLILDGVFREADIAGQSGDDEQIGRIYRDALREKGNELVAFERISQRYYDWGKSRAAGKTTVRDIVGSFERKHREPDSDVFAIGAYRGALGRFIAMAKEQEMTGELHLLERRETRLKKLEEKLGKEQSKNAGR